VYYESIKPESKIEKDYHRAVWCNALQAVTKSQKTVKKCKPSFDDKMLKHESARKKNTKSVSSTANSLFRVKGGHHVL
jgi:Mn-containing catalase